VSRKKASSLSQCRLNVWPPPLIYILAGLNLCKSFLIILQIFWYHTKLSISYLWTMHIFELFHCVWHHLFGSLRFTHSSESGAHPVFYLDTHTDTHTYTHKGTDTCASCLCTWLYRCVYVQIFIYKFIHLFISTYYIEFICGTLW